MKRVAEGSGNMRYLGSLLLSKLLKVPTRLCLHLAIGLCLLTPGTSLLSQANPEVLVKQAISRLKTLLTRFEEGDTQFFTPEFFNDVPKEKLVKGLSEKNKLLGPVQRTRICRMITPFSAEVEFIGEAGKRVKAVIRLEQKTPFRIQYILFAAVDLGDDTWDKLNVDLQKLPGDVAVSVEKLTPTKTKVFSRSVSDPLAVGSSFKLLILSLLCDEITAGKRKWTDIVTLREEGRSLPSGLLQDWPVGSPVTLHTLATMMIARSDNTAADHLMLTLGREALEQHQVKAQVQYPERNRPFLRTNELFKMKLVLPHIEASFYAQRHEEQKRQFLSRFHEFKLTEPRLTQRPTLIDQIEWFYTTDDLVRMLDGIRQSPQQSTALPILAVTRPFDLDDHAWEYLGFKGGAEMGVLNLSLLGKLRSTGQWYALSLTWNRTDAALDEPQWLKLAQRCLLMVERGK